MALNDSAILLASSRHLQDPQLLSNIFESEIRKIMKEKVNLLHPTLICKHLKVILIELVDFTPSLCLTGN